MDASMRSVDAGHRDAATARRVMRAARCAMRQRPTRTRDDARDAARARARTPARRCVRASAGASSATPSSQSVCPDPAKYPDIQANEGCSGVINDWSGGIADEKRNRLLIWGGGHRGYFGNEVYALDLNAHVMRRLNDPSDISGVDLSNATRPRPMLTGARPRGTRTMASRMCPKPTSCSHSAARASRAATRSTARGRSISRTSIRHRSARRRHGCR